MNSAPRSSFASGRGRRGGVSVTHLHRGGADPVRVLMVADLGVTAVPPGGAASHFADAVLDRLWLRVRRGLDVDVVQQPWAALHAIAGSFEWLPLSQYDLVVVVVEPPELLGGHERRGLVAILQAVLLQLVLTTRVVLIVLDPADGSPRHHPATDFSPDLIGAARSPTVPLTMMRIPQGREGSADAVAIHLQAAIDLESPLTAPDPTPGTGPDPADVAGLDRRLAQITHMARSTFGSDVAAVNLADDGSVTTIANDGAERGVRPLAGSLCDLNIGQVGLVVVGDTWAVPSLRAYRAVRASPPIRFYAGYPLSAPGRPGFGALCLYDRAPHERDEFDFTMLRDLALLAEGEVMDAGLR